MSKFITLAPTVIATGGTILSLIALKVETDSKTQFYIRVVLSISASSALVGFVFQLPEIVELLKKVRHQIFEEGLMYEYLAVFVTAYVVFFTLYILYDFKTERELDRYSSLNLLLLITILSTIAGSVSLFYFFPPPLEKVGFVEHFRGFFLIIIWLVGTMVVNVLPLLIALAIKGELSNFSK